MKRLLILCALALTGCGGTPVEPEKAGEPAPSPFNREPYDHVLILAVDGSGSFKDMMKPGGLGIAFANTTIDHYVSDRIGSNDFLVVTQMSGNHQAILWAGAPRQLHEDFVNVGDWAELVQKHADANGSRIWDGLSDSLELVMSDPSMFGNGHTHVAIIAITDMENNLVDKYTSEQRLTTDLTAFAKGGGVIGMYFVGTDETIRWRSKLLTLGFKDFVVSPAAETKPRLPSFE